MTSGAVSMQYHILMADNLVAAHNNRLLVIATLSFLSILFCFHLLTLCLLSNKANIL